MADVEASSADAWFLAGGGELGALIRAHDWSATPLGASEAWPQPLKTLIGVMLGSNQPMFVAWGAERTFLYNDAYSNILVAKHPDALGRDFLEVWHEIRADLLPIVEQAYRGEPVHMDDIELLMLRKGYPEEAHFAFSYTPVRDERGRVAGLFCPCTEITAQVFAERRRTFCLALEERLRAAADPGEVIAAASEALGRHLGAGQVAYADLDASAEIATITHDWNDGTIPSNAGQHRIEGFGTFVADLKRGATIAIGDVALDRRTCFPEVLASFARVSIAAFLNVPLVKAGHLVAVLAIHSAVPRVWSPEEVALVEEVAERTWAAIERARTEVQLRESEARFRALATASSDALYRMSPDWVEMHQLDGRSFIVDTTEPSVRWVDDYLFPEDRPLVMAAIDAAVRTRGVFELEHRVRRIDGSAGWIFSRAIPVLGPDGEVVEWFGTAADVTARKEAEEALRASEAHHRTLSQDAERKAAELRAVLESMPDAVYIGSTEGIMLANQRALAQLGFATQEELNRHVAILAEEIQTRDAETDEPISFENQAFTRAFHGERVVQDVRVRHRVTGEDRIVRCAAAPVMIDDRVIAAVAVNTDVTDQRRTQRRLRDLNETLERRVAEALAERKLWADVFESTDALIAALSPGRRFLAANKAYTDAFERFYRVRAKLGDSLPDLLAHLPEQREKVLALWDRAISGEEFTATEVFGEGVPECPSYELRFNTLRDRDGNVIGAFQYAVDVTERLRNEARLAAAEAARREADALYRAYFENTAEALFVIGVLEDGGFTIEELNPAHEAATGLRMDAIRGKRLEEQLPLEIAEELAVRYRQAVATGEVQSYRQSLTFQGRMRHWDTVLVPIFGAEGHVVRLIGAGRDVTGQILAEEGLRQAQKMEAVGQLTGGIAHDFNNLLSAVVGGFDLIRRKPDDPARVRRIAENGLAAAERGAKLTGQLLAFSRAQKIEQKPLLIADVVEGMRDMLGRTLGPQVRVTYDLDRARVPVMSDPVQLEMAVLNLAINARDAMPEGGALTIRTMSLQISSDPELPAGDYVELSVSDSGMGMPPDVVARAFDPFFTTKGVGKGTGLGMSQVYGIARQTGGTARIESRSGAGTTVRLLLPRTDAEVMTAFASEDIPADGAPAEPATVLLIDDDDDVRQMLAASLDALGYRVIEAADGPSGLAALDAHSPNLILVDFAMPGMNGAEMVREAQTRHPDLPIVFASGYADTAAIEAVAGDGTAVLRKPFRIGDLQAVLAKALGDSGSRASGR